MTVKPCDTYLMVSCYKEAFVKVTLKNILTLTLVT